MTNSESTCNSVSSAIDLWHKKLGHSSRLVLNKVLKSCNSKFNINKTPSFCDACQLGKIHALPFKRSVTVSKFPLQLIHADLWGPAPFYSGSGYKYYLSLLDDFTRFTWIYPLLTKSEAFNVYVHFKVFVENQLRHSMGLLLIFFGQT